MKILKARPVNIPVLMICGSSASKSALKTRLNCRELPGGALEVSLSRTELKRLLPIICEHSEAVLIGSVYRELYREHRISRGEISPPRPYPPT